MANRCNREKKKYISIKLPRFAFALITTDSTKVRFPFAPCNLVEHLSTNPYTVYYVLLNNPKSEREKKAIF